MNIMMQLLYKMFSIKVLHSNQAVLFINGRHYDSIFNKCVH